MTHQLYIKQGRRYIPWGNGRHWDADHDAMEAGSFRLIHCPAPGHYRTRHDVTPDTARWAAAAMIAQQAMEDAMRKRAIAQPQVQPYTDRQLRLIEQFRRDMAAAGGLVPSYWRHGTPFEIAQEGIDAVRKPEP
jgi:hypothetical protein